MYIYNKNNNNQQFDIVVAVVILKWHTLKFLF